jgi:hypothetical protein
MEKLRNGTKFDEVAREFSEDKARQGMFNILCHRRYATMSLTNMHC